MLKLIQDTREQTPWTFDDHPVEIIIEKLDTGDYSLPGLTDKVAIERKSMSDLLGSITQGRKRFERELARSMPLESFCIVCEGSYEDFAAERYRSRMPAKSAIATLNTYFIRYGVPTYFAGSKAGAEYLTYDILRLYLAEFEKRHKAAMKGQK